MACTYRREEIIRREMEAAWQPPSPNTELPSYDPEADPFCPLGIARKFNALQREAATRSSRSLIDLKSVAGESTTKTTCSTSRPRSSGACTPTAVPGGGDRLIPPFLAGAEAAQRLRDGGSYTAVQRLPFFGKGLPTANQVSDGLAKSAKGRRLASKVSEDNELRASTPENTLGVPVELGADAKRDFVARVARRDDLLQDMWLKMHAGEGFARAKGDIAQLINLYRSASLTVLEDMARHPELEKIANAHTKKKGEGMRSYREAVAQDADFADVIPEASSWFGFSTRRNPLFLPPRGRILPPEISVDGAEDFRRLRDAQSFVLSGDPHASASAPHSCHTRKKNGVDNVREDTSRCGWRNTGKMESSGTGKLGGRVHTMNSRLVTAQETMHDLEESLRSLEGERVMGRRRAARLRETAAVAGRKNLTRKMFRLRGTAACVEEGIERLDGEIAAVRVRLFAERLEVERRRMLKNAFATKRRTKSRARRRRARKNARALFTAQQPASGAFISVTKHQTGEARQREDRSSTVEEIQAQWARSRINATKATAARDNDNRCREAAMRVEAAAHGCLAPKWVLTKHSASTLEAVDGAETAVWKRSTQEKEALDSSGKVPSSRVGRGRRGQEQGRGSIEPSDPTDNAREIDLVNHLRLTRGEATATELSNLEALGPSGFNALFDCPEPRACTERLCKRQFSQRMMTSLDTRSGKDLDGTELARIARSPDPDAELLAVGVGARLHRVKVITSLGLKVPDRPCARSAPCRWEESSSGPRDDNFTSVPCDVLPAPIATPVAVQMIRRLRRDQKATIDALQGVAALRMGEPQPVDAVGQPGGGNGSETSAGFQKPNEYLPALTHYHTSTAPSKDTDGAFGDASVKRISSGSGGKGGSFLLPLRLLSELEEAVSAQENMSRQARELLEVYAGVQVNSGFNDQATKP